MRWHRDVPRDTILVDVTGTGCRVVHDPAGGYATGAWVTLTRPLPLGNYWITEALVARPSSAADSGPPHS